MLFFSEYGDDVERTESAFEKPRQRNRGQYEMSEKKKKALTFIFCYFSFRDH